MGAEAEVFDVDRHPVCAVGNYRVNGQIDDNEIELGSTITLNPRPS